MDTRFSVVNQVTAMRTKTREKLSPLVHFKRLLVRLSLTIRFSQLNDWLFMPPWRPNEMAAGLNNDGMGRPEHPGAGLRNFLATRPSAKLPSRLRSTTLDRRSKQEP
jgi:hypothetical protein